MELQAPQRLLDDQRAHLRRRASHLRLLFLWLFCLQLDSRQTDSKPPNRTCRVFAAPPPRSQRRAVGLLGRAAAGFGTLTEQRGRSDRTPQTQTRPNVNRSRFLALLLRTQRDDLNNRAVSGADLNRFSFPSAVYSQPRIPSDTRQTGGGFLDDTIYLLSVNCLGDWLFV